MEMFDTYSVQFGQVLAVSEHSLMNQNKHQIMNVHTKWNCLIPILFSLVKYYLFQSRKR